MKTEVLSPINPTDQISTAILLSSAPVPSPSLLDSPLNERQTRFCDAYVRQPIGRYAAIEAGYAPKGAAVQASRLLEHPAIRARIDAMRADIATRNCDRVDAILSKLEAIYEGALSSHQFHAAVRAVELQVRLSRIMRDEEAKAEAQTADDTIAEASTGLTSGDLASSAGRFGVKC